MHASFLGHESLVDDGELVRFPPRFSRCKGAVSTVAKGFCAGIRSGLSYCGGHTVPAARDRAECIRVAPSAQEREGYHADHDWEGVSVDSRISDGESTAESDD